MRRRIACFSWNGMNADLKPAVTMLLMSWKGTPIVVCTRYSSLETEVSVMSRLSVLIVTRSPRSK